MEDKFPLFPELTEQGKVEAQELTDRFKDHLRKAAEEVLGDLYSDVLMHIESDSWVNFREHLVRGICNYQHRNVHGSYDFERIRRALYEQYRPEIIDDLNQDNLKRIAELEQQVAKLQGDNRRLWDRVRC